MDPSPRSTRNAVARSQPAAAIGVHNQSGQVMGAKGLATRRKLIEATEHLLAERPIASINVVDIARLAKVSAAAFYNYFENVTDAVLAASQEVPQATPAILALFDSDWSPDTAPALANALVAQYLEVWDSHRALFRARNLAAEEGDARFTEAREGVVRPLLDALTRQVERVQGRGLIDAALPPNAVAGALAAMLERIGQIGHLDPAMVDSDREVARSVAHIIVKTLRLDTTER